MTDGYKRVVSFLFEVRGAQYVIEPWKGEQEMEGADIEELRKNGHEDTYFYAEVYKESGCFVMSPEGQEQGRMYGHDVDGIMVHINEHGLPKT